MDKEHQILKFQSEIKQNSKIDLVRIDWRLQEDIKILKCKRKLFSDEKTLRQIKTKSIEIRELSLHLQKLINNSQRMENLI